jgi:hypothetical protein
LLLALLGGYNIGVDAATKTMDLVRRITGQEVRDTSPGRTAKYTPVAAGNDPASTRPGELAIRRGARDYRDIGQFFLSSVIARDAVESSDADRLAEAQKGYERLIMKPGTTEILGRQGLDLVEQGQAGKNIQPKLDEIMRQIALTFEAPSD